jgi:hypothetical protein
LLSIDYSQIELRIVAHFAKDEAMLMAFHANQDIHAATAAAIYNIPIDQVTKEQRRHAKHKFWSYIWDECFWTYTIKRSDLSRSGSFC